MNIYRHLYAIVGLGVVLAAVSVANTKATVRSSPTQSVVVTNTNANPVRTSPVGNTSVVGSVGITNGADSPLPVHDVDQAGRTAFTYSTGFQLGQFDTDGNYAFYTVPAGKRLVVESVIMSSFVMPEGQHMVAMGLAGGSYLPFEVHDNGADIDGHSRFVAVYNGHLRFAAGTQVKVFATRDYANTTVAGIEAVIDGYLEPM